MSSQATVLAGQEHSNTLKTLPQSEIVEDGGANIKRFPSNTHLCPNNGNTIKANLRTLACQANSNGGQANGGRTFNQNNQTTSAIRYSNNSNSKISSAGGGGGNGFASSSQSAGGYQLQYREELNKKRERLFRLLSKVPIQVETVSSLAPQSQQSSLDGTLAGSTATHTNKNIDKEPLLIKYYSERSLAEIIELHFSCSLVKHNYERGFALDTHLDKLASLTAVPATTVGPRHEQQRYDSYLHHVQANHSIEQPQPTHHHQPPHQPQVMLTEPVHLSAYSSLADSNHQVYGPQQHQPAYSHQQPIYTDWQAPAMLPTASIKLNWHQSCGGLSSQQEANEKEPASATTITELAGGVGAGETASKSSLLNHQASQQRRTSSAALAIKGTKQSLATTIQSSAGQRQAVGPLKTRQRRQNQSSTRQPNQTTNGNNTNNSSPSNQSASNFGSQIMATNYLSKTMYDHHQQQHQVSRDEPKAKYHHLDQVMSIASPNARFNCDASYSTGVSELCSSEPSACATNRPIANANSFQLQHDSLEAFTPIMGIQEAIACDQHQQYSHHHYTHLHHQLDQPQYTATDLYMYTSAAYAPSQQHQHQHQLHTFELNANQRPAQHQQQRQLFEQSVGPMSFCGEPGNSSFCHQKQAVAYSRTSSASSCGGGNIGAPVNHIGRESHLPTENSCDLQLPPPSHARYYNQASTGGGVDYVQITTVPASSQDGFCFKGWQVCGALNSSAASQASTNGNGDGCLVSTEELQQQMIDQQANENLSESYERNRGFFHLASGSNYARVYATDTGESQQTAPMAGSTVSLAQTATSASTTTTTSTTPPSQSMPAFGGLNLCQNSNQQQEQHYLTDRPVLQ